MSEVHYANVVLMVISRGDVVLTQCIRIGLRLLIQLVLILVNFASNAKLLKIYLQNVSAFVKVFIHVKRFLHTDTLKMATLNNHQVLDYANH